MKKFIGLFLVLSLCGESGLIQAAQEINETATANSSGFARNSQVSRMQLDAWAKENSQHVQEYLKEQREKSTT